MTDARTIGSSRPAELALAVLVFVGAAVVGARYTAHQDRPPQFFQEWFAPAVMLASGHGYTNVDADAIPALAAFLDAGRPEADTFDPATLPAELPTKPLMPFQQRHRYLLTTVAWCFAALGIGWASLWPLYALLFGTTSVAAYGLFRTVMGRAFALLCTVMLVTSPLHLLKLPGLRDYSKAPFILLAMLAMAVLLTRPMRWRGHVLLGAAAGLAVGVGVGFRIDVLIVVPPLLLVMLVFATGPWRRTLGPRLAGAGTFFVVMLAAGGPILFSLPEGGNKSHPALLGLADRFDGRLELAMPPYDLQHTFYDAEVMLKLQAFEKHRTGAAPLLEFETPEYERIADDYYGAIVRTFPADMVIRALAAVPGVVEGLRPGRTYPYPLGIDAPPMKPFYTIRYGLERMLLFRPFYMMVLLLLGVAALNLRPAFGWCFLALFFTGYTAVQYSTRHSFHLEFLPLLIGAAFYQRIAWAAWHTARSGVGAVAASASTWLRLHGRAAVMRVAVFSVVVTSGLFGPLWALRCYQQAQVKPLLEAYLDAPRPPTGFIITDVPGTEVLVQPHALPRDVDGEPFFDMRYLTFTFDTADEPVEGAVVYLGSEEKFDLTHRFTLPATGQGVTVLALPAFSARTEHGWLTCEGLRLPDTHAGQLVAVEAYDAPFAFPFYMTVVLPPAWSNMPLYQRRR